MTVEAVQLSTTTPDEATAERMAAALLDAGAAACVQVIGPVRSHYRWEGQVRTDTEWLCLVKTTGPAADAATSLVLAEHPYDEPEVIVTPIVGGSASYLDWVRSETRS